MNRCKVVRYCAFVLLLLGMPFAIPEPFQIEKRVKRQQNEYATPSPDPYWIPGPFEPLPGRSPFGNYWPLFPLSHQYSMGVDFDSPIESRRSGLISFPILGWGMFSLNTRLNTRIQDTVTKFGYQTQPVNMLHFSPNELIRIMQDQRYQPYQPYQPRLPIAKIPKSFVPMSCLPPLCNPFVHNFGAGFEQELGGADGILGEIDFPIPVARRIGYRFPLFGNFFFDRDNVTVTYGQNMPNVDPIGSEYRSRRSFKSGK